MNQGAVYPSSRIHPSPTREVGGCIHDELGSYVPQEMSPCKRGVVDKTGGLCTTTVEKYPPPRDGW